VDAVQQAFDAGVTDVHVHQIGPRQDEFLEVAEREILPEIRSRIREPLLAGAGSR
jgi:hypothetical protein